MANRPPLEPRAGANQLDGGAHFYDAYECADGRYISIGAIEPQFYALLRGKCGLDGPELDAQMGTGPMARAKAEIAAVFQSKTRANGAS